jgi:hypothetical protein
MPGARVLQQPETDLQDYASSGQMVEDVRHVDASPVRAFERPFSSGPSVKKAGYFFSLPTRAQVWAWVPFGGVWLVAALLRFWQLGSRPLHHDESLHAYYSLQLLHNTIWQWSTCATTYDQNCYVYQGL